ncbi:MAG: hypothetical protein ACREQO_02300 [Candidatus Binatia bacterium]
MTKFFGYSFILIIALLVRNAYGDFTGKGHVHTLAETRQVFVNPDCRTIATCDLKRFTLTTLVHEVWFSDDPKNPTYGNGAIMEYETDSVDALEKYAIVQFVKGCVFNSSKDGAGKVIRNVEYVVPSFGESVPLCFPEWVIDSQDSDPAYNSDPEYGRFYLLRWNKPGFYDGPTQKYYGAEKPRTPVVYLTDYPAGAFVTRTGIKNAALKFKTCIYKASEVPTETRREDINFAKPLNCFNWQNVYVYDFDKGRFDTRFVDLPIRGAPDRRVHVHLILLLALLFLALAVLVFLRLGRFSSRK